MIKSTPGQYSDYPNCIQGSRKFDRQCAYIW